MADLSHALDKALLRELKCPVCTEYMVPPIKQCTNGHNICSKCTEEEECCPTCRAEFTNTRNVALESIARRQKYPCANRQSGCLDLFSNEHIAEHQAVCTYGQIKCLLNKGNEVCPWMGFKIEMCDHAKRAHQIDLIHASEFISVSLKNEMVLVFCFGEIFLNIKQVQDGRFSCVVQLIGPSSRASKYKCEFKLYAANGIEQISKTFTVRSYEEDTQTSLNSGKCFREDDELVRNFIVGGGINLKITLSKVQ